MDRDIEINEEMIIQGPEHWEGRAQSDWDGSCVVITRKEDKGRQYNEEALTPLARDF